MIEDKPLLSEYLSESEELLDSLMADLDLLALASPARPDVNLINNVFRTVHSLKGLTGMMGLTHVQSLAHQFEDILDSLRLGKLDLDKETAALIQEAGSGLAALVGAATRGDAGEDDGASLRDLLAGIAARPLGSARAESAWATTASSPIPSWRAGAPPSWRPSPPSRASPSGPPTSTAPWPLPRAPCTSTRSPPTGASRR